MAGAAVLTLQRLVREAFAIRPIQVSQHRDCKLSAINWPIAAPRQARSRGFAIPVGNLPVTGSR